MRLSALAPRKETAQKHEKGGVPEPTRSRTGVSKLIVHQNINCFVLRLLCHRQILGQCGNVFPKAKFRALRESRRTAKLRFPTNTCLFKRLSEKKANGCETVFASFRMASFRSGLASPLQISHIEIDHMKAPDQSHRCMLGCTAPVPPQLIAERLCVLHFTFSVERTCAEWHRQIALGDATAERRVEAAAFIDQSALLLARLSSNLCLSDGLKSRILSTFLSLMNLRENLERAESRKLGPQPQKSSVASARMLAAESA